VWGPGAAPVLASEGRPGSWGRRRRGKGVRAVDVRWTRRLGPGVRPRVRGGPSNRARWANRAVPSMAPPRPPIRGAVLLAPPCEESSRGRGAWGGAEGAQGKDPCSHAGAHKKGGRRGTDAEAVHYRPSPFPSPLLELRAPPRPSMRSAPPSLLPSPSPSLLPGRGGYGFLAVDGSGADRGDGFPKCGACPAGAE